MHSILKAALVGVSLFVTSALAAPAASSPDAFITAKAKLSLWTTAGVRSTTVRVDTTDGRVTLSGKVPTVQQRAIAEKTAAGIDGVRSVNNLIQVVAVRDEAKTARADRDIKEGAEKQLKADGALKDSSITVKSVDKGVVMLTGQARTYSDHLRAIALVDRIAGVQRIASEVKSPTDYGNDERIVFVGADGKLPAHSAARDTRITMDVKMRLLTAAQIPSGEISVDTDDNVVTLFGIVPTNDIKNSAAREAAKVNGVQQVDDQLEVVASAAKKSVDAKDGDISRDLALAFKDLPAQKHVTSTVKNGTVRLTGDVPTAWDQLHALRIARAVDGVRGVESALKVE